VLAGTLNSTGFAAPGTGGVLGAMSSSKARVNTEVSGTALVADEAA